MLKSNQIFRTELCFMKYEYTSLEWAKSTLPKRKKDSNKGSYGRLFMYVGSSVYPGAAHLSLEAALRGGVGYVEFGAEGELKSSLLSKFPETIFKAFPDADKLTPSDMERLVSEQRRATATLVGCGSGKSDKLFALISALLSEDGGTLILDADAINSMADNREEACRFLRSAERKVILTPHPLEFSRLSGLDVAYINENREKCAVDFAKENKVTLLLKGNGTVITNGEIAYVNTSGSSALAKAGSGDSLAGLLSSLAATLVVDTVGVAALAAFIHGLAGDNLAKEFSEYGVTPSDLPKEMARVISAIENS
ncbi:MAG: NAD(P)H-hydrate dehydratase [Ruminococcaceae bacterium]|nr:NAD(P)H-hydrate dehydratase [Oscillospiraceae bacterium]